MAVVNYWAHLPYLRISEETVPFGPGQLWRLPFEVWSYLTGGAYDDQQSSYDATQPVFFYCEIDADWPIIVPGRLEKWQAVEIKKPTHEADELFEEMGFAFLTQFLKTYAWSVQAALNLAAPAAGVGTPRHSMTFCAPDDSYFQLPDQTASVARIQGDADHELPLLAEASSEPVEVSQVQFASELWPVADACRDHEVLGPALEALMSCAEPSLSDVDQMVLATVAIEALLLPEVHSGLQRTFTERLTELLDFSQDEHEVERMASGLYEARSAALHGEAAEDPVESDRLATSGAAQQLLGACILALAPALVMEGVDIEDLRKTMDPGSNAISAQRLDLGQPPGLRPAYRLGHTTPTSAPYVISSNANMEAEEGGVVSWSPLLGLGCPDSVPVAPGEFIVVPLNGVELVDLEERDIARDFVNEVRVQESLDMLEMHPIGCIALFGDGEHSLPDLERRRELAVLVLRLAGFAHFVDPTLLGWFIYEGRMRIRIPTVFRQTIIRTMVHPPEETLTAGDESRLDEVSMLVASYDASRRNAEIDRLLRQFLRGHGSRFLSKQTCASLMFGVLEGILGRFRPKQEQIQLEDLVAAGGVASPEATWFADQGRDFRNAVAHGRWDPETHDPQLETLTSICAMLFESLLEFTVESDDDQPRPTEAFLRSVEAQIGR